MSAPVKGGHSETILHKSALPLYAVGALWVLYALLFPLYRWFDFVIAAALSVALYLIMSKLFPGEKVTVYRRADTGDQETDRLLVEGRSTLLRLEKLGKSVRDQDTALRLGRIVEVAGKIFDYVEERPEKAPLIRRFMGYYLPTTVKLLETYCRLDAQDVEGENITETMRKIREVLATIEEAFEKQLDSLFSDEALDISTDITVLEGLLHQEGLSDGDFKQKS